MMKVHGVCLQDIMNTDSQSMKTTSTDAPASKRRRLEGPLETIEGRILEQPKEERGIQGDIADQENKKDASKKEQLLSSELDPRPQSDNSKKEKVLGCLKKNGISNTLKVQDEHIDCKFVESEPGKQVNEAFDENTTKDEACNKVKGEEQASSSKMGLLNHNEGSSNTCKTSEKESNETCEKESKNDNCRSGKSLDHTSDITRINKSDNQANKTVDEKSSHTSMNPRVTMVEGERNELHSEKTPKTVPKEESWEDLGKDTAKSGRRVAVYWPDEGEWRRGTMTVIDPNGPGTVAVKYDTMLNDIVHRQSNSSYRIKIIPNNSGNSKIQSDCAALGFEIGVTRLKVYLKDGWREGTVVRGIGSLTRIAFDEVPGKFKGETKNLELFHNYMRFKVIKGPGRSVLSWTNQETHTRTSRDYQRNMAQSLASETSVTVPHAVLHAHKNNRHHQFLNTNGYVVLRKALEVNDCLWKEMKAMEKTPLFNHSSETIKDDGKRATRILGPDPSEDVPDGLRDLIRRAKDILKRGYFIWDKNGRHAASWALLESKRTCQQQRFHTDFAPEELAKLVPWQVPLSVMVAVQPGSKLCLWDDEFRHSRRREKTEFKFGPPNTLGLSVGDIVIWRGDVVHCGAPYDYYNVRLFAYLDTPYVAHDENRVFFIEGSLSENKKRSAIVQKKIQGAIKKRQVKTNTYVVSRPGGRRPPANISTPTTRRPGNIVLVDTQKRKR
eukprot:m.77187 g.77187  ORF g.77187 m.77187 type:complete len:724 (-) comp12609_c0_seq1:125-2296(-)